MNDLEQLKEEIKDLKEFIEEKHSGVIGTLDFNLEDAHNKAAFKRACNADEAYHALYEVGQEIFRPARKHGYSDTNIQKQLELCGENGEELVSLLETKFYQILQERGINLNEDLY